MYVHCVERRGGNSWSKDSQTFTSIVIRLTSADLVTTSNPGCITYSDIVTTFTKSGLNWRGLEDRCKDARLVMVYKIENDNVVIINI